MTGRFDIPTSRTKVSNTNMLCRFTHPAFPRAPGLGKKKEVKLSELFTIITLQRVARLPACAQKTPENHSNSSLLLLGFIIEAFPIPTSTATGIERHTHRHTKT